MDKFDEITKQFEELEKKSATVIENKLKLTLKNILDEFSEVESVSWTMYTPGFNDGDPCEFRIGDVHFKPTSNGWAELGLEVPENEDHEYELLHDLRYELSSKNERAKNLYNALQELYKFLTKSIVENYLKDKYYPDNNLTITVNRKGWTKEYYDCGY